MPPANRATRRATARRPSAATANGKPRRLQILASGEIELPLARPVTVGGEGSSEEINEVRLPDGPPMSDVAAVMDIISEADNELDEYAPWPDRVDPNDKAATDLWSQENATVARKRNLRSFSLDSPHAKALCAVTERLTGITIEVDDLPGWAGSPTVCAEVVSHYMDPFAGRDDLVAAALEAATRGTTT